MLQLSLIFMSSFSIVFLLGLQSQFVRDKWKIVAFITSLMIGLCEIVILKSVPNATYLELGAFVLGGPCGIVCSILLHDQILKLRKTK